MTQGLLLCDSSSRLIVCNERYIAMYGLSSADGEARVLPFEIFSIHRKEIGSFKGDVDEYCSSVLRGVALGKTVGNTTETPDGRSILIVSKPVATADGSPRMRISPSAGAPRNRSGISRHYDALTDLPNRALFHERLKEELAGIVPGEQLAVVVYRRR